MISGSIREKKRFLKKKIQKNVRSDIKILHIWAILKVLRALKVLKTIESIGSIGSIAIYNITSMTVLEFDDQLIYNVKAKKQKIMICLHHR